VTWEDKYGNKHDLDFVIELEGTEEKVGKPIAFIKCAWRRYTKHSKNKAQEIQGAILPIVERYEDLSPFYGAVLAGNFTKPSLKQLENHGFTVLYIPHESIVIDFNEDTPDQYYQKALAQLSRLKTQDKITFKKELLNLVQSEIDSFMNKLKLVLDRYLLKITILPLFGKGYYHNSFESALKSLSEINYHNTQGKLQKVEVIIEYNNQDTIRASFQSLSKLEEFLRKLTQ
jgi:hypothetical protein